MAGLAGVPLIQHRGEIATGSGQYFSTRSNDSGSITSAAEETGLVRGFGAAIEAIVNATETNMNSQTITVRFRHEFADYYGKVSVQSSPLLLLVKEVQSIIKQHFVLLYSVQDSFQDKSGVSPTVFRMPAHSNILAWEHINNRRLDLIELQVKRTLSSQEQLELAQLQAAMRRHVAAIVPPETDSLVFLEEKIRKYKSQKVAGDTHE